MRSTRRSRETGFCTNSIDPPDMIVLRDTDPSESPDSYRDIGRMRIPIIRPLLFSIRERDV